MKLIQAASQFSLIALHAPPAPHNDITSPSKRSTSITTQPCRARTRGRCGCATIARPGGPSLGCAVVGYYYYSCCCCVFFAFVAIHIRALVFGCVCRHTPALVLLIMYASRVFRYNRAQPRPSGRWQPRVKGCRTAARVKFCEGARTCVRTWWHYSNASRGLPTHKTNNAVCLPVFRTQHPDLRRRRIDFCCARMLPEISAKNFPRRSWWAYFYSDGKKRFPTTSQALFLSDLEGVTHSRFTLQPPPSNLPISGTLLGCVAYECVVETWLKPLENSGLDYF